MKLIITTKEKEFVVRIANYVEPDLESLIKEFKTLFPTQTVVHYALYGDAFYSPGERKQIDYHGKITTPPIEIPYEALVL
jgi:hypothetical protein